MFPLIQVLLYRNAWILILTLPKNMMSHQICIIIVIIVLRFNASESMIPYSRNQFLDIRASCHLKPSMWTLKALMDCGIFKYRGRRAGRRRITTVDSSSITSTEPDSLYKQTASTNVSYYGGWGGGGREISLDSAVWMHNLSGTSRLIFYIMLLLPE